MWSYNSLEWTSAYGPERGTIIKNRAAILPGRRVGIAEEVAQVILMLMTNDYLTGEVVHVDGGDRFVSQCSIDPKFDRWAYNVPATAGNVHALAVLTARGDLQLAGNPAAEIVGYGDTHYRGDSI